MIENVVVAVDGGPASEAALAWVAERARTRQLRSETVSVVDTDQLPAEVVLKASANRDLLVLGTKKTSAIAGILNGTLPLKVAGHTACPTVVVPVGWQPRPGDVVVGWTTDATSDAALDFAAKEASRSGRGLTIIHTWTAIVPTEISGAAVVVQELVAAGTNLLEDAAERVRREYPSLPITKLLHGGSPAVAIAHAAETASLIVVGSRGRGPVAGFFLGSTSHNLLLNMTVPVVVIPHVEEPVDVYPELVEEEA